MAKDITKQMTEAIARMVWELLDERYGDRTAFGPIAVVPRIGRYDGDHLCIYVGYNRKFDTFEAGLRLKNESGISTYLEDQRVEVYSRYSFIRTRLWSEGRLGPPPLPETATIARVEDLKVFRKRHLTHGDAEFLLEPLSKSAVRVTHRDQMGYFGIHRDWEDNLNPYTSTRRDEDVHDDGIGGINVNHATPDDALASLCTVMLDDQVGEDARRTRSDRWQESASDTLQEFMEGLPREPGPTH